MGQTLTIIVIILSWIISFVEPSGWSYQIHLPDKINATLMIASTICFFQYRSKRLPISQLLFLGIVLFLVLIPYAVSSTWDGASYTVAFLATYIVSQGVITTKVIKYSSIGIAILGLTILLIYAKGSVLSGWNDNAISMTGLFSYIYFTIFLMKIRNDRSFWTWNIFTVLYLSLLFATDCRSGMIFSSLAVIAILYSHKVKNILENKRTRLMLLNFPLIISGIVLAVASSPLYNDLNSWSIMNTDKPVFNGRNELWDTAYKLLSESNFLGTGEFLINYHNSGVAALSVFGVLGYICWIKFFSHNLTSLSLYLRDKIVFGSSLAFILIFLQQSFDLGLIEIHSNLIPYMILGVGIGRVRYLQQY